MTSSTVAILLEAFTAALVVEEVLIGPALQGATGEIRAVIETLRTMTGSAIEAAISAPANVLERAELLRQAVDFDGADSPLAARCAKALAETILLPAPAPAG